MTAQILRLANQSARYIGHKAEPYNNKLLDEVEYDIMNYQNRGLCYLPKPKAEANNTDTRFW